MENKKSKSVTIYENQRGILYQYGKFKRIVGAGRYCLMLGKEIEVLNLADEISLKKCTLSALLKNECAASQLATVDVGDEEIALHFVNGRFASILRQGKHAFWAVEDKHEFTVVDISTPEVDAKLVPEYVFSRITQSHFIKVEVAENQKARVYFDHKLVKTLTAGVYYFWKTPVRVDVVTEEITK